LLKALRKEFVIFPARGFVVRFGVVLEPEVALCPPLLQFCLRQGIGEPKGDEVSCAFPPPVGEIAGEKGDGGLGIK
jgi:hypothetical protein